MDNEINTCDFCRSETTVERQYLHAKNKKDIGDGFRYIYYCKECGLAEFDLLNDTIITIKPKIKTPLN